VAHVRAGVGADLICGLGRPRWWAPCQPRAGRPPGARVRDAGRAPRGPTHRDHRRPQAWYAGNAHATVNQRMRRGCGQTMSERIPLRIPVKGSGAVNDGRCDLGWYGSWEKSPPGADDIYLYTCEMHPAGTTRRREVMAHEFGHALGLADGCIEHQGLSYLMMGGPDSVDPFAGFCGCIGPGQHEKNDYYARWGCLEPLCSQPG